MFAIITSKREERSEFFFGLREKSEYERSDPTRPDPVTLLRSLYIWLVDAIDCYGCSVVKCNVEKCSEV